MEVVDLLNVVSYSRRISVVTRSEMSNGKFVSGPLVSAENNRCPFTLGYFETRARKLLFRISCEKFKVDEERFLRSV